MNVALRVLRLVAVSWIALVVAASGVHGVVLCFGDDGHFALKMDHQGRCIDDEDTPGHEHHDAVDMTSRTDSDCCASCTDVSVSLYAMLHAMTEARHSFVLANHTGRVLTAVSPGAGVGIDLGLALPRIHGCPPLRASRSLLTQRTIVLRT